ncbi:MAG: hypothetical protein ACOC1P_00950 [Minisyncoccales bacterium]
MIAKNIDEFINSFVKNPSFSYIKKGKSYFLKVDELNDFVDLKFSCFSLPLGEDGKFFKPSLFLLELLSRESSNKIFLNDTAEWLFLCGRDAFLSNISKNNSKCDVFLVQNSRDENLGLGTKTKHKGKVIIKNIVDRGDFLRREK